MAQERKVNGVNVDQLFSTIEQVADVRRRPVSENCRRAIKRVLWATHTTLEAYMKRLVLSASVLLSSVALLAATTSALADKKPQPKPQEFLVIKMEEVIISSRQPDGTTQWLNLSGRLHLGSQLVMDADGKATEFSLHANLMDAFAFSPDGELRSRATGSGEMFFEPSDPCIPTETCQPGVWTFTFKLVPAGPGPLPIPYPNSSFTLPISTQYDAAGKLISAAIQTD